VQHLVLAPRQELLLEHLVVRRRGLLELPGQLLRLAQLDQDLAAPGLRVGVGRGGRRALSGLLGRLLDRLNGHLVRAGVLRVRLPQLRLGDPQQRLVRQGRLLLGQQGEGLDRLVGLLELDLAKAQAQPGLGRQAVARPIGGVPTISAAPLAQPGCSDQA
jgi:hypothetical protein